MSECANKTLNARKPLLQISMALPQPFASRDLINDLALLLDVGLQPSSELMELFRPLANGANIGVDHFFSQGLVYFFLSDLL